MTLQERKRRIINKISEIENEELVSHIEELIQMGNEKFETEILELLSISNNQTNLSVHTSAKSLIKSK